MSTRSAWTRPFGLVAGWLVVAALAVAVGVVTVTRVGGTLSDRGPLGNQAARNDLREGSATPDPSLEVVQRTFAEEFGEVDVSCQGAFARGVDARPRAGWRTVSFETGPDDDVDAVFARAGRSIEIEVFCNRGEPTVSEVERNELPDE
ncbi:hypothetical protein [Nocardioides currus]|uniref:Septum formation initiator n=1 Tax=Nocardioides currus TaxID=2133958 RepID=A0A2R7YRJ2_9ACTN|nr:hypothetical protein [Nocardioides currus]PUA79025.1 hypothetical protein C7S10_21360 [Nocardioides currus]